MSPGLNIYQTRTKNAEGLCNQHSVETQMTLPCSVTIHFHSHTANKACLTHTPNAQESGSVTAGAVDAVRFVPVVEVEVEGSRVEQTVQ